MRLALRVGLILLNCVTVCPQDVRFFPQVGDGASDRFRLKTAICLVNTGVDAEVRLDFRDGDGAPWELELAPFGRASSFAIPLPSGHTILGETPGTGLLQVGYARLDAPAAVGGTAVFTGLDTPTGTILFEAGVPAVSPQKTFTLMLDSTGDRNMGLAIVYPPSENGSEAPDVQFAVNLWDTKFSRVASRNVSIQPGHKIARYIHELFEGDGEAVQKALEMQGSVSVDSPVPLAAVTLRQMVSNQPFPTQVPTLTTFPVVAGSAQSAQWQLAWADDFEGESIDLSKWEHQIGGHGWGNAELQYYTSRPENSRVENGRLIITARNEWYEGNSYTSARMRTKDKGDWKYGRFEIRAKLPRGKGIWPAIWMMPTDDIYGTWAASGEIDIMEFLGHETNKVYGTLHYGGEWPNNLSSGTSYVLPSGNFADEFHVFALEWQLGEIRWYVDGTLYQTQTQWHSNRAKTPAPFPAPFDQRFHLILNVAVGGRWPGSPDQTTQFPQQMEVDYVRVYQRPQ